MIPRSNYRAYLGSAKGFTGFELVTDFTIVQPSNFKFTESLDLLVFVAIGGRESFLGAVAGALFLTILSEELRFSAQFRLILFGASLTLVMMILPGGLIGRWSAGTNPVQAVLMMFRPVVELVQSATKRTLYSFTYIVRSARRRLSYEAREGPDQKSD